MQFRQQGRRVQVLAYRGYNKEKKRADVKMLGSFDRYTFEMTDGLLDSLTVEEKEELTSHIEELRQSADESHRRYVMSSVVSRLKEADPLLVAGMAFEVMHLTADEAAAVWRSMKALGKMLEAAGHPAPKRAYGKNKSQPTAPAADPRQASLIETGPNS